MRTFKQACKKVLLLNEMQAMWFFQGGLDKRKIYKLLDSLCDYPTDTLQEMYVCANSILRKEETLGREYRSHSRNDRRKKSDRSPERSNEDSPDETNKSSKKSRKHEKWDRLKKKREETVFTPLNSLRSHILNQIKNKPGFERTPRMRVLEGRKNTKKYYDYHPNTGHTTKEYFNLMKLIKKVINNRELDEFIAKDKEQRKNRQDLEPRRDVRGEINIISGGSLMGRSTMTARKKYAKEVYNLIKKNVMPLPYY